MRLSSLRPLSSSQVTPDRSTRIGSPLRDACASSQLFSNTSTQSPASVPSTNRRCFEPLRCSLTRIMALCLHPRSGGAGGVLSASLPSTCPIQGGDGLGSLRVISIEDQLSLFLFEVNHYDLAQAHLLGRRQVCQRRHHVALNCPLQVARTIPTIHSFQQQELPRT